MSVMYQPAPTNVPGTITLAGYGLRVATIIFGVIAQLFWSLSIGFTIGWGYEVHDLCTRGGGGPLKVLLGSFLSVPTNAAMLYVTARIIFVITSRSFPSPVVLNDLHQCVARMVACTGLGLTTWAMSLAWLVMDDCEFNLVYHICNYGFVLSALVAGLAGGLWTITSKTADLPPQQVEVGAVQHMASPPLQAHHNDAYVHKYNGSRL